MKDQPLFELDDTTTSYSPPRAARPRWMDQGSPDATTRPSGGAQVTAQHWFDPDAGRASPAPDARVSSARRWSAPGRPGGPGRVRGPLFAAGVAIALVSAGIASAATVGLLAAGGWLDRGEVVASGPGASRQPLLQPLVVDQSDATRAAAAVAPAVVTIVVSSTSDDPLTQFVTQGSTGATIASGIIYDFDEKKELGWIITNRHVVCGAGALVVLLKDGRRPPAELYGIDSLTDLAIIRIEANGLTVASIGDSATLRPGQLAMAIGSSPDSLTTTVTSGVISALGRDLVVSDPCGPGSPRSLRNIIQTDAAATEGSSGGPLVNAAGDVVGVSTSITGAVAGTSFAVPIDIAKPIMEQAVDGKPLTRPYMGITYTVLNVGIKDAYGLSIDYGAWLRGSPDGSVPAVLPGSPADHAGLQEGDILTAIDGQRIDSAHPLDGILAQYRPEDQDPVTVSLLRDGTPMDVLLTLSIRPEEG